MPLYEYRCESCCDRVMPTVIFTLIRPMRRSSAPAPCPACGVLAPRILSAASVNVSAVIMPSDIKMTPSAVTQPVAHRRLREREAARERGAT